MQFGYGLVSICIKNHPSLLTGGEGWYYYYCIFDYFGVFWASEQWLLGHTVFTKILIAQFNSWEKSKWRRIPQILYNYFLNLIIDSLVDIYIFVKGLFVFFPISSGSDEPIQLKFVSLDGVFLLVGDGLRLKDLGFGKSNYQSLSWKLGK